MPFTVWDEIKSKLTVSEVIADYLPVQSAGAQYRCLCPFHDDKKPSMMINDPKGIWHCFVCGAGGDIFKFVCDYENISKRQVLEKLAKKSGVALQRLEKKSSTDSENTVDTITESEYEQGLHILAWTTTVYHQVLLKILENRAHPVTQYCLERNILPTTIAQFQLGYAPKGGFLLNLMKQHGLDISLAIKIGVIRQADSNEPRDKFTDRLMIPIKSRQGKVVGFTARNFPYDTSERPKYLNSSQSQWFNKSEIWFGWDIARSHIIQAKHAIIVEGNMDVVAGFQHGIRTTLASQGTSFTLDQLKILKQITKSIWVAFDNDEAGIKSGLKLFEMGVQLGFNVEKVLIPLEFKDLDEYLQTGKADIQSVNYIQWYIDHTQNKLQSRDLAIQKNALYEILRLIKPLDPISQRQYIQQLALTCGLGANALEKALDGVVLDNKLTNEQLKSGENLPNLTIVRRQYTDILVAWQYIASTQYGKPESVLHKQLFVLLKKFLIDLQSYADFDDYQTKEKAVLDLVREQQPTVQLHIENNLRIILHFLDQHINEFLLDENIIDVYLQIKMSQTKQN